MRGVGSTISRLPKVAAWVAGAAMLAGTFAPRALAQSDETAMAVPRLSVGGDAVVLPRPLAAADAALFHAMLAKPRMPEADWGRLAARIDMSVKLNDEMLGVALAERYLALGRRNLPELQTWLVRYAALPQAHAVAALAAGKAAPAAHAATATATATQDAPATASGSGWRLAQKALERFTANDDTGAVRAAEAALRQSPGLGCAAYVAGLASWRLARLNAADSFFAQAATASHASAAERAAGAFWAGRASLARGDAVSWRHNLTDAAALGGFYGRIASRILADADDPPPLPVLGEADAAAVASSPGGLRALALLQVQRPDLAAAELRTLAKASPDLAPSAMLVAEHAGLFDVAADLAELAGKRPGMAGLNVPRLAPRNGFLMDPALVYAVARVESNFDPHAVSKAGAEGLMQLMPGAARAVTPDLVHLHDPAVNLDLGQRYLYRLASAPAVSGDLIRLLASYNGGPVKLGAMLRTIHDENDPLLFIEAIPMDETRNFVKRTLEATWAYAESLHLPSPSLDALAEGRFPRFSPAQGFAEQSVLH